jgi:dTDP-4-dehydrorhamnose reductase
VKALVAGAHGQLGRDLVAALGSEVAWAGGRAELDVTDWEAVSSVVRRVQPDVIFNGAAYNKVDGAESETGRALEVNALAPGLLARAAAAAGALVVHFSTDYVFDGRSKAPYREDDCPAPLGAYGVSKLAGERLVLASPGEHLVVRTSSVFGRGGNRQKGGSFIERILEQARAGQPLRVVSDQTFSPTYAPDLAEAAIALVRAGARGLVHVVNAGSCSWHEFATTSLALAGIDATVAAISTAELGLPARRPAYSVLDTGRYHGLGLAALRPWREALAASLAS